MRAKTTPTGGTLVLSDGGIAGLLGVATASEESVRGTSEPGPAVGVWAAWPGTPDHPDRFNAVTQAASAFRAEVVTARTPDRAIAGTAGEAESALLIRAAAIAAERRWDRVLWPVHLGDRDASANLEAIAIAVERALLVSRLASLDGQGVTVETPFVDFTDAEMADLAADLGLTADHCWWAAGAAAQSPEGVAEHRRWSGLLGVAAV